MRFPLWRGRRTGARAVRRRSPFNNLGPQGLLCGQVTPKLFVGGELGPRDWHALTAAGVSVIVNLQHEQQDRFGDDEKVDGYLWLPSPDQLAPSIAQLIMGVQFIRLAIRNDKGVFVHCMAGQGRAPLLCACYLISEGMAPLDAVAKVREARPQTLLTAAQSDQLRAFSEQLEKARQKRPGAASKPGAAPK